MRSSLIELTYRIVFLALQELGKGLRVAEFLDRCMIQTLPELAPHGVEHDFGKSMETGVLDDLVVVEEDAFPRVEIGDVGPFLHLGHVATGPSRGFDFEFQPGVDVVAEQRHLGVREMLDLVNGLDRIAHLHGLLQFGSTPGAREAMFVFQVAAQGDFLQEGMVDIAVGEG